MPKNLISGLYSFRNRHIIGKYYRFVSNLFYRPLFKSMGERSVVVKPLKFTNPQHISIGNKVSIYHNTWLLTLQISEKEPELVFGDGTTIGHFNHITCVNKVTFGKHVLTADKVYVSDHLHGYEDVSTPICFQPVLPKGEVSIGDGTWIGENVSIIGVKIGKNCVIGANSVVTKDVPDFCVAAGVPARVIKRYNKETGKWDKV
jgi:acetyltransferase-like isoleucine patch superfamily enzyme